MWTERVAVEGGSRKHDIGKGILEEYVDLEAILGFYSIVNRKFFL